MKIATWNLWSKNNRQIEAIDFLLEQGIDIMCLQELKEESVKYIKEKSGVSFSNGIDFYYDSTPYFLGVISQKAPSSFRAIEYKTKLKSALSFDYFPKKVVLRAGIHFQFSDFVIQKQKIRVFNAHLAPRYGPTFRLRQLSEVSSYFTDYHNVMCGDFNTFSKFPINYLVGWLLDYKKEDYQINDMEMLKRFALKNKLKLGFENKVTSLWHCYKSHLDHVLVPLEWKVKSVQVHQNRYGSDHRLVVADIF